MAPRRLVAALLGVFLVGTACTPDPGPAPSPTLPSAPSVSGSPSPPGTGSPSPTGSPGPTAAPTPTAEPSGTTPAASAAPSSPAPVDQTVAPRPQPSKTPVELDKRSATGTGLTARLVALRGIEAKAKLPGEISGPALAVTVEVTNTGSKAADLSAVVVSLADSDEAPGSELTAAPADPLPGRVAAGAKERGVYVFRVPEDKRRPVTVTVSIGTAPVLVFTGDAD